MAEKVIIPLEVDASGAEKEVKEVKKEIKEATKEQTLFSDATEKLRGSFNKLKGGVRKVIATFKGLTGAIAATGLGLLVIALGSLVVYFTKTQAGADKVSEAMAGIGAAVDVVVDRVSNFGASVLKLFKGDTKGAVEGMKNSFKGLGEEIKNEVKAAATLKKTLNELLDTEREFSVQRAKNNVLIREAEAIAADQTVSLEKRTEKLKEALDLVETQANREEEIARQRFEAIQQQNALGESTREDLEREAEAEINLINIRAEAADRRKALIGAFQSLQNQQIAIDDAEAARLQKSEDDKIAAADKEIELAKKVADEKDAQAKREIKIAKDLKDQELAAFGQLAGALSSLAGDNKELAAASAIIDTYTGANKAFAQGGILGFVSAAAIIAAGLGNVKKIYDTKLPTGGGGGGGGSVPSVGSNIAASLPTQTNLSDVVSSVNQSNQEPIRAYVIGQDVTDSQEAQSYLNNQKTL
jgi:DNA repair exonuclease SbcCD ATPase subunit